MALTTAAAAIQIMNGTWTALQNMRERVQASKDNALKVDFGNLLNNFNSLRTIVIQVTEENDALRVSQVAPPSKPEIRQVGETNYYFIGDEGPYCQPCYDCNKKLINLTPQQKSFGGLLRKCLVCNHTFYETTAPMPRAQIQSDWP